MKGVFRLLRATQNLQYSVSKLILNYVPGIYAEGYIYIVFFSFVSLSVLTSSS